MVDSYDPDEHLSGTISFHYSQPPTEEAYTALNVRPPDVLGYGHTIRLKIDTGASGNTLPLGTFRQMYGSEGGAYKRLKKNNMRLSAYSDHGLQNSS